MESIPDRFPTGSRLVAARYSHVWPALTASPQLTDRTKDVIKSGGEWSSSVELENAAVGHPAVAEAACIGMPHPKWDERPVLFVVRKEGAACSDTEVVEFLSDKVAKWWLPDAVEFVDDIPHTATGKISKKDLRDRFADYRLEG